MRIGSAIAMLFWFLAVAAVAAAEGKRDGVYIIYDSSQSMWGALPDQSRKYEAARLAMLDLAGRDFGDRDVALRMYGHRRKDDCSDSELVMSWRDQADAGEGIVAAMEAVRPTGRTPIDRSLRAALEDFGDRSGAIILISDGIESCDADPCALVSEWRDRDVKITVHVVGLGLRGKERAAMECIAEAAGTEYRDAFSAGELVEGLEAVVEASIDDDDAPDPGEANPAPKAAAPQLTLTVITADGVRQKGMATLTPVAGGDPFDVESFSIHYPQPGDYIMKGGVKTLDGSVYAPIERRITVLENGRTEAVIEDAPRPPEVSAQFSMDGAATRDTVVTVYREGEKLGSFHGDQGAFLQEGTFEFRTTPSGTSQDLSLTEVFAAGDAKELSFEAATEVKLIVHLNMLATADRLISKPTLQLFQDGELVKGINSRSGGLVFPGRYQIQADDSVNHYETEIDVTSEPEQLLKIDLPSASVTVSYKDIDGRKEEPKRVFVYPESGRRGVTRTSETAFGLLPGTYVLEGHPKKAEYPRTTIDVAAGDTLNVILQATK
jgi:Ca-activated chloride channel family protein